jgi:cyclopropane-fatty-acyl-phospholipid synthase
MAIREPANDETEAAAAGTIDARAALRTKEALSLLFGETYLRGFSIALWDGSFEQSRASSRFVLRVNAPFALRAALTPPIDLRPGVAFARGLLDLEGDVVAGVDAMMRAFEGLTPSRAVRLGAALLRLPSPPPEVQKRSVGRGLRAARLRGKMHSPQRDREAVRFHYDQAPAFFQTFLDPELVYSCAYFDEGVTSLEAAQLAKLDYILTKVRLREGERLLDIGCGWGSLVTRAAQRFGARATGITLSRTQYDEARRRIDERGLTERCSVELLDYRDLGARRFDKIVSVGMVEHVGRKNLATYFRSAWDALEPGGLFLNHGISEQSEGRRGGKITGFMERYVFPDGELIAVGDLLACAERAGFEVRDVENLREHYALTLRHWATRLEAARDAVIAATDERTYRIWKLYLAGSAQGFTSGRMALFQALLAKPHCDGSLSVPRTRRHLYAEF